MEEGKEQGGEAAKVGSLSLVAEFIKGVGLRGILGAERHWIESSITATSTELTDKMKRIQFNCRCCKREVCGRGDADVI